MGRKKGRQKIVEHNGKFTQDMAAALSQKVMEHALYQLQYEMCAMCGDFMNTKPCGACQTVFYCSNEHMRAHWKIHKNVCREKKKKKTFPYKITTNEVKVIGRSLIATRNIAPGELILEESPLFHFSPSSFITGQGLGQCVTCGDPVGQNGQNCSSNMMTRCPKCNWPVCSMECAEAQIHSENECKIFVLNAISYPERKVRSTSKVKSQFRSQPCTTMNSNAVVTIVEEVEGEDEEENKRRDLIAKLLMGCRGFSVWNQDKWSTWLAITRVVPMTVMIAMEHKYLTDRNTAKDAPWNALRSLNEWASRRMVLSEEVERAYPLLPKEGTVGHDFLFGSLEARFTKMIFNMTGFNVNTTFGSCGAARSFAYEDSSFLTDACAANCSWSIGPAPDYQIRVRAAVPIKKGSELTVYRYGQQFIGTFARQSMIFKQSVDEYGIGVHVLMSRSCICSFCSDPTEHGTYQSALVCPDCRSKVIAQDQELNADNLGFLLPKPEIAATLEEIESLTLSKEDMGAILQQPTDQLWACHKCGSLFKWSENFFHRLMFYYTKALNDDVVFRCNCGCASNDSILPLKEFLETEADLYLHPQHFIFQLSLATKTCKYVPNFPSWPQGKIKDEEELAKIHAAFDENISRYSFLIKMLNETCPGLQPVRVNYLLKFGIGVLNRCIRTFSQHLEDKSVDVGTLPETELWATNIQQAIKYLQETLIYWQGAWPARGQTTGDMVQTIRDRIQLAQKYYAFLNKAKSPKDRFKTKTASKKLETLASTSDPAEANGNQAESLEKDEEDSESFEDALSTDGTALSETVDETIPIPHNKSTPVLDQVVSVFNNIWNCLPTISGASDQSKNKKEIAKNVRKKPKVIVKMLEFDAPKDYIRKKQRNTDLSTKIPDDSLDPNAANKSTIEEKLPANEVTKVVEQNPEKIKSTDKAVSVAVETSEKPESTVVDAKEDPPSPKTVSKTQETVSKTSIVPEVSDTPFKATPPETTKLWGKANRSKKPTQQKSELVTQSLDTNKLNDSKSPEASVQSSAEAKILELLNAAADAMASTNSFLDLSSADSKPELPVPSIRNDQATTKTKSITPNQQTLSNPPEKEKHSKTLENLERTPATTPGTAKVPCRNDVAPETSTPKDVKSEQKCPVDQHGKAVHPILSCQCAGYVKPVTKLFGKGRGKKPGATTTQTKSENNLAVLPAKPLNKSPTLTKKIVEKEVEAPKIKLLPNLKPETPLIDQQATLKADSAAKETTKPVLKSNVNSTPKTESLSENGSPKAKSPITNPSPTNPPTDQLSSKAKSPITNPSQTNPPTDQSSSKAKSSTTNPSQTNPPTDQSSSKAKPQSSPKNLQNLALVDGTSTLEAESKKDLVVLTEKKNISSCSTEKKNSTSCSTKKDVNVAKERLPIAPKQNGTEFSEQNKAPPSTKPEAANSKACRSNSLESTESVPNSSDSIPKSPKNKIQSFDLDFESLRASKLDSKKPLGENDVSSVECTIGKNLIRDSIKNSVMRLETNTSKVGPPVDEINNNKDVPKHNGAPEPCEDPIQLRTSNPQSSSNAPRNSAKTRPPRDHSTSASSTSSHRSHKKRTSPSKKGRTLSKADETGRSPQNDQIPFNSSSSSKLVHYTFIGSKFPLNAKPMHLQQYLEDRGIPHKGITIRKFPTQHDKEKHTSFHIEFDASIFLNVEDPNFWPGGTLVQRLFDQVLDQSPSSSIASSKHLRHHSSSSSLSDSQSQKPASKSHKLPRSSRNIEQTPGNSPTCSTNTGEDGNAQSPQQCLVS